VATGTIETEEITMDTKAVAGQIGTDARTLRRFLRDGMSSFTAVGSGGRYAFTPTDVPIIKDEFTRWSKVQSAKPSRVAAAPVPRRSRRKPTQADIDREVWAEEERIHGPIQLPDIRNPRVLAEVRRATAEANARLDAQLRAAGLVLRERVPA
jgi:hypothetical protein